MVAGRNFHINNARQPGGQPLLYYGYCSRLGLAINTRAAPNLSEIKEDTSTTQVTETRQVSVISDYSDLNDLKDRPSSWPRDHTV